MKFFKFYLFIFLMLLGYESYSQLNALLTLETLNSHTDANVAHDNNTSFKVLVMDEEKTSGKKVFVWQQAYDSTNGSTNNNIYAMVYDKNMVPQLAAPARVNTIRGVGIDNSYPAVLVNQTDGSVYISWSNNNGASNDYDIYLKRVTFANFAGDCSTNTDHKVNSNAAATRQIRPLLAYDYSYSELVVGWLDQDGQDTIGGGYGAFARRVSYPSESFFSFPEAQFIINNIKTNHQTLTDIAINPVTGELYTVCQSIGYGTNDYNIVFRKFIRSSSGNFTGQGQTEVVVNSAYKAGSQTNPVLTVNKGSGSYIISWTDWDGQDGYGTGIYSKIYDKFNSVVKSDFRVSIPVNDNQLFAKPIWDESSGSVTYFYSAYLFGSGSTTIKYQVYDENLNLSGTETDALGGLNIGASYGWSHFVSYNQQNKKIFLCYDLRPSNSATVSTGKFRQFAYVPPAPAPPLPDNTMNYAESQEIWKPIADPNLLNTVNSNETRITRDYIDGLGRTIQRVIIKGSPGKKDVVQPIEYDNFGRQVKSYLPYAAASNTGAFKTNALNPTYSLSDQYLFYNNNALNNGDRVINDNYPYKEIVFESSVANRVNESSQPGNSWRLTNGHTSFNVQNLNTTSDNVRQWTFDGTTATSTSVYSANTLYKHASVDEMGKTVEVYMNKKGQTILKREYPSGCTTTSCQLDAYSVYDAFGNVSILISPDMVGAFQTSGTWAATYNGTSATDNMLTGYKYDKRQRVSEKKLPNKAIQYILYNKLNLPVLTQDGNQRTTNKWSFVKYDALGRSIISGTYTDARTLSQIQADIDSKPLFEKTDNTNSYTNVAYPIASVSDLLVVNYYDNNYYNGTYCNSDIAYPYTAAGFSQEPIPTVLNMNKLTGSKIRNLGDNNWLITELIYDKYGQVIQKRSNNHKNYSVASSKNYLYDFAGKILSIKKITNTSTNTITVLNRFEYDHAGRLKNTFQTNGSDAEILLSQRKYNEIGQSTEKNLHSENQGESFLQSLDFTYNIRGWLTYINNGTLTNSSVNANPSDNNNDMNDLFGFQLAYDNVLSDVNNTPMFNGNISAIKSKVNNSDYGYATTGVERASKFSYDPLYRLTDASFALKYNNVFDFTYNSCRETISYYKNGNIKNLQRYNYAALNPGPVTATAIDNLTYVYPNPGNNPGNQLLNVTDAATVANFNGRSPSGTAYSYDANGNLTQDLNKGIYKIKYNHLNLPTNVIFTSNGYYEIAYTYDASGKMLSKSVNKYGSSSIVSEYVEDLYYLNNVLQYFLTMEGRAYPKSNGTFAYQYHLKDHLGNVRITFEKNTGTGKAITVQENNFYAFGGKIANFSWNNSSENGGVNNFLYCSNEYQSGYDVDGDQINEYDWDVYDFGARMYDGMLGRWHVSDPSNQDYSPYAFCGNDPINNFDPNGMTWLTSVLNNRVFKIWLSSSEVVGGAIMCCYPLTVEFGIPALGAGVNFYKSVFTNMSNGMNFGEAIDATPITGGYSTTIPSQSAPSAPGPGGNRPPSIPSGSAPPPDVINVNGELMYNTTATASLNGSNSNSGFNPPTTYFESIPVYEYSYLGNGAMTLPGIGIFVGIGGSNDTQLLKHEFGHILQMRQNGMANFYCIVAPYSLLSAQYAAVHRTSWTEIEANNLSYNYFGQPANWDTKRFPLK